MLRLTPMPVCGCAAAQGGAVCGKGEEGGDEAEGLEEARSPAPHARSIGLPLPLLVVVAVVLVAVLEGWKAERSRAM